MHGLHSFDDFFVLFLVESSRFEDSRLILFLGDHTHREYFFAVEILQRIIFKADVDVILRVYIDVGI